ncbi:phosphoribosyltransferase-like protein [Delftia sp. GW456-R20]|uniref:phosphoribosyltransferase-like protein n=1 Tax=Delftia sp. GW456-R20 TaxID=1827145 RepID=UPI000A66E829|nr:hypothetical protein [Delftia sp. GW456-R20]
MISIILVPIRRNPASKKPFGLLVSIENLAQEFALNIPWIGRHERRIEALVNLLEEADSARSQHGPALVGRLLERFTFLSTDAYEQHLLDMAKYIDETFDLNRTILCATTADRQKDSAQRVLYDLVSTLAGIGRYKVRNLNRYDAAAREQDFDALLLVDEFIGSGQSFVGRVKNLRRIFDQQRRSIPLIHGIALVGMMRGLRSISSEFESLNVCIALKKGIEDYATPDMQEMEYSVMSDLEAVLASHFEGEAMPSLGYAASEALYSRHSGSCPNNVFPIFWWPQHLRLRDRRPLLPRAL